MEVSVVSQLGAYLPAFKLESDQRLTSANQVNKVAITAP
jgi:hypothetical protein